MKAGQEEDLEEEDKRRRRVEKAIRRGGEGVAGSTSLLTKGKRGREKKRLGFIQEMRGLGLRRRENNSSKH